MVQPRYNGYTASCSSASGLVRLYNTLSVVSALEANLVFNFWVETGKIIANNQGESKLMNLIGRCSPLSQKPLAC